MWKENFNIAEDSIDARTYSRTQARAGALRDVNARFQTLLVAKMKGIRPSGPEEYEPTASIGCEIRRGNIFLFAT